MPIVGVCKAISDLGSLSISTISNWDFTHLKLGFHKAIHEIGILENFTSGTDAERVFSKILSLMFVCNLL